MVQKANTAQKFGGNIIANVVIGEYLLIGAIIESSVAAGEGAGEIRTLIKKGPWALRNREAGRMSVSAAHRDYLNRELFLTELVDIVRNTGDEVIDPYRSRFKFYRELLTTKSDRDLNRQTNTRGARDE